MRMRPSLLMVLLAALAIRYPLAQAAGSRYLLTWAGDADRRDSDFLAVVDVQPNSATYRQVLRTVPVGETGTNPHHTEHAFAPGRSAFASGFGGNRTFRFD